MSSFDGGSVASSSLQPSNPAVAAVADAHRPSNDVPQPNPTSPSSSTLTPGASHFPLSSSVHIHPYNPSLEPLHLPLIQRLISGDLSEPYSIYCYRYFLHQWPSLCFLAFSSTDPTVLIGAVVSKLEQHRGGPMRGYIGMLAVASSHRGKGIATKLVALSIDAMIEAGADEIALETEVSNTASLKLYERLGFLRSKRLYRYYLNGSSAFRLVLYVREGTAKIPTVGVPHPPFMEDFPDDKALYT